MLTTITPFFAGKIIGSLYVEGADHFRFVPYFIGTALLGAICNRIGFPALLALQARTQSVLQARCLNALLNRGVSFHSNNVGGKLVSDATDFPNAFGTLIMSVFGTLLPFSITLIVGTVIMFLHSWILGCLILAMAVFTLTSSYIDSRRRAALRVERLKANKAVTAHLADSVVNVQTVKTFAREDNEYSQHLGLNQQLLDLRLRDWLHTAVKGNSRIVSLLALQVIFVISLIYLVPRDPSLLGIGIFGFTFTITMSNRLFDVSLMLLNIEDALLQASPMTEILQQETEIKDAKNAKPLKVSKGAIVLNQVGFRYADAKQNSHIFSKLDIDIKPGEKVGLVGPSGGGKSTLTRLLLRFEDIDSGSISIDGQNIAEVTQASLRQSLSYVPQEPLLFHRTILENIAYGRPSASRQQIEKAAKQAHAHDFIRELSDSYDTIVGERGVKLSGGQRQRIAIARAILKDAPILVLDEATSALDSESESYIQDALNQLMKNRTAIVIAHRLSTIQHMDRILVLEDGTITEHGSHATLLKQKGTYAKLWKHQSGGFIDE